MGLLEAPEATMAQRGFGFPVRDFPGHRCRLLRSFLPDRSRVGRCGRVIVSPRPRRDAETAAVPCGHRGKAGVDAACEQLLVLLLTAGSWGRNGAPGPEWPWLRPRGQVRVT